MAVTPEVQDAINRAVERVRAAMLRMYADGDIGSIVADCGPEKIDVKANPIRKDDPVLIGRKRLAR